MAEIFDIVICPICNGEKEIESGRILKDARIYVVKSMCPKCHGHGRVGIKRQDIEK